MDIEWCGQIPRQMWNFPSGESKYNFPKKEKGHKTKTQEVHKIKEYHVGMDCCGNISSLSAINGFWSQSSAPLTCFQHRSILSSVFCIFSLRLFFRRLYYFGCLPSPGPPVQQAYCHHWTPNKRCEMPKFRVSCQEKRSGCVSHSIHLESVHCWKAVPPHPSPSSHQTRMSVCWRHLMLESITLSSSAGTTVHFTLCAAAGVLMHYQTSLF